MDSLVSARHYINSFSIGVQFSYTSFIIFIYKLCASIFWLQTFSIQNRTFACTIKKRPSTCYLTNRHFKFTCFFILFLFHVVHSVNRPYILSLIWRGSATILYIEWSYAWHMREPYNGNPKLPLCFIRRFFLLFIAFFFFSFDIRRVIFRDLEYSIKRNEKDNHYFLREMRR